MKKQIILLAVGVLTILLFASVCVAENISVSGSITANHPKTIFAEGTFTFNPDEIIPNPEDTEKCCRPVVKRSPVFSENEKVQLIITALKCGPYPLYYSFTIKYYDINTSLIISHENLEKIKRFRIQLDSSRGEDAKLKTPKGDRVLIYFEGELLEK